MINRVVFTGRMGSGKDWLAGQIGFRVVGFADPIYQLADRLIGSHDKSQPGVRLWLQRIGCWGRGEVSERHPLSIERHEQVERIRALPPGTYGVGYWHSFGQHTDFWTNNLIDCLASVEPEDRVCVPNARFQPEVDRLVAIGFEHFHVAGRHYTPIDRLRAAGQRIDPDDLMDSTEHLAIALDVLHRLDRTVWNDPRPPDQPGQLTVEQFAQLVNQPDV